MRIAVAAVLMAVLAGAAASAQTGAPRDAFISVAGEGNANVAPDFAEFFAEVVTRAETADGATRQHGERASKAAELLRGLEKQGVGIERSSFRLEQGRPIPRPGGPKQPPPEYRASTTFAVKVNRLDALSAIVSTVAASGLFEIRNLRYGVRDEERAKDEARRAAVVNARRQAEIYAAAAGVGLGEILEMFDGLTQPIGSEAALRAATPNVQVAPPATIAFRAAITIKWRIVPKP